jgi:hypothetical protein
LHSQETAACRAALKLRAIVVGPSIGRRMASDKFVIIVLLSQIVLDWLLAMVVPDQRRILFE